MVKKKTKSVYMHLLDGKPAVWDEDTICFAGDGTPLSEALVSDLRTIRKQQQAAIAWRWKIFGRRGDFAYGYRRFTVPVSE